MTQQSQTWLAGKNVQVEISAWIVTLETQGIYQGIYQNKMWTKIQSILGWVSGTKQAFMMGSQSYKMVTKSDLFLITA